LFESGFISSVHGDQELEFTLTAAEKVFNKLKKEQNVESMIPA
jgi:glutamate-1-semialdehyde aminotransferase